ncbi:MAG: sulfurtransferase TusA family protein [Rhodospirillales bacterium]
MTTRILDAKGLSCPLPVLRANKALKELAPGEVLEVQATDRGAPEDFISFCEATGSELMESREVEGVFIITIRKGG